MSLGDGILMGLLYIIVLVNGRYSLPLCLWFGNPLASFNYSDGVFSMVTAMDFDSLYPFLIADPSPILFL
jgi:hypothetical protein